MGRHRREASTTELLSGMAASVAEHAPEGWRRAWVSVHRDKGGARSSVMQYELADGDFRSGGADLFKEAGAMFFATKPRPDHLTVELAVEPMGEFEAITSQTLIRTQYQPDRLLLVLKPDVLPAEPGDEQEGPADPTFAGDPDEVVRLFREYFRLRAEIFGEEEEEELPPPLDEATRAEFMDNLDVALPPDLAALYGVADGDDGEDVNIFDTHSWVDLEFVADHPHHRDDQDWTDDPLTGAVFEAMPPGKVRRSMSRDAWIVIGVNEEGDFLAVDMDPGPAGHLGQVIIIGGDYAGAPVYIADSVTTLLRRQVEALERGDYDLDDDRLYVNAGSPNKWEYLESFSWDANDHGGSLVGMSAEVQRLTARKADGIDLEPARHAPLLRDAVLLGQGSLDLSPLRDAPLETLTLELGSIDPTPLAGHPALRNLTLRSQSPVETGLLPTLPRLQSLDLTRADVTDMEPVTRLEGLLFLALRYEQWVRFWELGGTLPSLAAVALGGNPSPSQIDEWTAHFTGSLPEGHEKHTGRFDLPG
ncbi:SMI1/KNR4 family protein [Saccharopolyspora sp. NPDC050389]|uniref:SMI1/KNR4 family protein n=1 Tax=Saccharopolyspora sp. NPDC050389 TaxID=3155516 RepID=UPI0033F9AFD7